MVAHPDRVRVRKAKANFSANVSVVLDDDVSLTTDVLGRRLDVRPNARFKESASLLIDHASKFDGLTRVAAGRSRYGEIRRCRDFVGRQVGNRHRHAKV